MPEKFKDVEQYMQSLTGQQKEWTEYFVNYMRQNHPGLEEVLSFQMPTYKLGSGKLRNYIAFSPAKNHFSMHSMDFEYIARLKEKLENPGDGKGCVGVSYDNYFEREILTEGIEKIIKRRILGSSS